MSGINKCASHRCKQKKWSKRLKDTNRNTHTHARPYRAMLHKMRHEPVLFTVMWVSSVFLPKTNIITLCAWISIHFDGTVLVGGCTWLSVRLSTPEDDKRKWNRPCSVARASRLTYDVSCCCHSHRSHRRSQIFISRYIREYGCNQCLATVYFPASHRSFFFSLRILLWKHSRALTQIRTCHLTSKSRNSNCPRAHPISITLTMPIFIRCFFFLFKSSSSNVWSISRLSTAT